jgi:hypothetical protein
LGGYAVTDAEIKAATLSIEDNFPDLDFETRQQFIDYVTSRFEFPHGGTRTELIEELAEISDELAQVTMDEIDNEHLKSTT